MKDYLWIATGGALGSALRHWLAQFVTSGFSTRPHTGILLVNITGCLAIGILASMMDAKGWPSDHPARHFLLVGILGGYTTFSTFSLQTLHLLKQGEWVAAGLNIFLSVALCLAAVALGYMAGNALK